MKLGLTRMWSNITITLKKHQRNGSLWSQQITSCLINLQFDLLLNEQASNIFIIWKNTLLKVTILVTSSVPFFVLLNQIVLLDLNIYSKEINASKWWLAVGIGTQEDNCATLCILGLILLLWISWMILCCFHVSSKLKASISQHDVVIIWINTIIIIVILTASITSLVVPPNCPIIQAPGLHGYWSAGFSPYINGFRQQFNWSPYPGVVLPLKPTIPWMDGEPNSFSVLSSCCIQSVYGYALDDCYCDSQLCVLCEIDMFWQIYFSLNLSSVVWHEM